MVEWDAVVASSQRAPAFSLSFGLVSGEVRGTHLAARWVLYLLLVCQVALGPRRWCLGAGFHLLGHFRGPIPSAWVVHPGR